MGSFSNLEKIQYSNSNLFIFAMGSSDPASYRVASPLSTTLSSYGVILNIELVIVWHI